MTTDMQIAIANQILATGLVKKVFHSCQLLKDAGRNIIYPAYKKGAEFVYTGIDDTQGLFAYIRVNGDVSAVPLKLQSCARAYTVTSPLRVVFFNDSEDKDFEYLVTKLSSFTFLKNVTLIRIVTDKFRLVSDESPLFRDNFDGKTFYIAVDISVTTILLPSDCEADDCKIHVNPLLPCPVVAQTSTDSAIS